MKTVTFTVPAMSGIKTDYREDGTPKAGCFAVSDIFWESDGLRYTVSPFIGDDGKVLMWIRISPAAEMTAESLLAHFSTTGEPTPKKEPKSKSKKTREEAESEIV